jgi:hypothetical protein
MKKPRKMLRALALGMCMAGFAAFAVGGHQDPDDLMAFANSDVTAPPNEGFNKCDPYKCPNGQWLTPTGLPCLPGTFCCQHFSCSTGFMTTSVCCAKFVEACDVTLDIWTGEPISVCVSNSAP